MKIHSATCILLITIVLSACEKQTRPNIIFLMDDQHRADVLGIVNDEVYTLTLDALAKNGVLYTQAVCQAPMCIASRYSMMLGLYPNQIGIFRNEPGLQDDELPNLPLAQIFKDAGYETAGFGKAHWSVRSSTRGFDTRYNGECFEKGAKMMIDLDPEGKKAYDQEIKPYGPGEEDIAGYIGETSSVKEENHRDGWVFNRCLEFIEKRNDEPPLFLYLSFLKPHAGHNVPVGFEDYYKGKEITVPAQPPWETDQSPHALGVNTGRGKIPYADFWENATEEQWKEMTMRYYANCTWIDDMFGRTLESLEKKGLLKNAIIVYVSDHGEMLGQRHYRFNKYCLYEGSVRVPVILSGSALPKEFRGKKDNKPVELVDVYPTLLEAAGITPPMKLPGLSLLGDETREASFSALHERKGEAAFMWRTEDYKLILVFEREENASDYDDSKIIAGEFYNLQTDQQEWNNLYNTDPVKNIQSKMSDALLAHLHTLQIIN